MRSGPLLVMCGLALSILSVGAQTANYGTSVPQSSPEDATTALRGGFDQVSGWVTKAAEMVPAEKYSYKPVDTVRTFGQLIAHIADSYTYFCAVTAGKKVEWSEAIEKGPTDKATLMPKLKQALNGCTAANKNPVKVHELAQNMGHTALHYGNVITYMRMMGLVPPSS